MRYWKLGLTGFLRSNKFRKYSLGSLAWVILFFASPSTMASSVLKVGVPVPGQIPFMWMNQANTMVGIYADTLGLIAKDLNVKIEYISLSQARLNRMFIAGEIDLEIGVFAQREQSKNLRESSVFSRPFGIANEVIVYNQDLTFPAFILKDLKGKKVAAVRGESAPSYIIRDDFASVLQIAKRVDRGWSMVGLMREAPAMHYKNSLDLKYKISLPYESNPISFRLHKKHSDILTLMNKSIEKHEKEGALENIICQYLCGN